MTDATPRRFNTRSRERRARAFKKKEMEQRKAGDGDGDGEESRKERKRREKKERKRLAANAEKQRRRERQRLLRALMRSEASNPSSKVWLDQLSGPMRQNLDQWLELLSERERRIWAKSCSFYEYLSRI